MVQRLNPGAEAIFSLELEHSFEVMTATTSLDHPEEPELR